MFEITHRESPKFSAGADVDVGFILPSGTRAERDAVSVARAGRGWHSVGDHAEMSQGWDRDGANLLYYIKTVEFGLFAPSADYRSSS